MIMLGYKKTSFILIKNVESWNCIKYINIIHYYIQGLIEEKELEIE